MANYADCGREAALHHPTDVPATAVADVMAPQCPWFAMRPQSQAPGTAVPVVCHATAVAGP